MIAIPSSNLVHVQLHIGAEHNAHLEAIGVQTGMVMAPIVLVQLLLVSE